MASPSPTADIDLMNLTPFVDGSDIALFDRLREQNPVHWNDEPGDGAGFWSLTRYADVKAAVSDAKRLSSAEGTQIVSRRAEGELHSLHNMDDPEHARLRKITAPYLRSLRIKQWQHVIDEAVRIVLDDAQEQGEFNMVEVVSARLPMLVLSQVLGVPAVDAPKMVDWTNRLTSADPDARVDASLAAARAEVMAYFRMLTEERRKEPKHDLVSVLVTAEKDGRPLTWEELAAYYILLVAAGNETTRHLISGATVALHEHPDAWNRMVSDPAVLPTAVEEMFRYVSPVACMRRTATEDFTLHDTLIRKGDKVVLWFVAANRDPEVFRDPHRFIADRDPNEHLSFGWGIHYCLGAHLARAEVTTLFREIIRRGIRLEVTAEPTRLRHNLFRGITDLPVRVRAGAVTG